VQLDVRFHRRAVFGLWFDPDSLGILRDLPQRQAGGGPGINLEWGTALLAFGLLMLFLARRRQSRETGREPSGK